MRLVGAGVGSSSVEIIVLSLLLPPVIDATLLAKKTTTINPGASLSAIPSFCITPDGTFTFGLAGRF
jgi:hypothetical protein